MIRPLILAPILLFAAAAGQAAVQGPIQSTGSAVLSLTATGSPVSGVSGEVVLTPAAKAVPGAIPTNGTYGRIVLLPVAKATPASTGATL